MVLLNLDRRSAAVFRLAGLALIVWTIVSSHPRPSTSGRGLVILGLLAAVVAAALWWTARPVSERGVTLDLYVMAIAGGLLVAASPSSAASAFVFVAVIAAGVRVEIARGLVLLVLGTLAVAVSVLIYKAGALGLLAYALGFSAALLAASNSRQSIARAEQAELLLAQTQRSQEEQLRAARLEESTRIAREIHDVLAHALAGLTIQLEATRTLVEQGAERELVLDRVARAHQLAREGLQETRRAVGALRGDAVAAPSAIQALVDAYDGGGTVSLAIDGDPGRLTGPVGLAVVRTVQEALTNVAKHAPGAAVSVTVSAEAEGVVVVVVSNEGNGGPPRSLSAGGGGYGLQGMRERAESLGGTVSAGPQRGGWRVALRLPAAGDGRP